MLEKEVFEVLPSSIPREEGGILVPVWLEIDLSNDALKERAFPWRKLNCGASNLASRVSGPATFSYWEHNLDVNKIDRILLSKSWVFWIDAGIYSVK